MVLKSEEIRNRVRVCKHFRTQTKISADGMFVEKDTLDR